MSQGNLTSVGFLWVLLSGLSAMLACAGYYLPYWVQGTVYNTTVHIGVFSRCNYLVKGADGLTRIEPTCGKYATFHDIPSEAWRAGTVMIGVGCGFLLLVALTAIFCCCLKDIATQSSARVAGALQFLSGCLLAISCGIYPAGWGSAEFKQACGKEANVYKLGDCQLGWGFFVFVAGTTTAFICAGLSSKAAKRGSMLYTRTNVEISNSFIV